MEQGQALPAVQSPIPAAVGQAWVERLAASECPALTTRRKRREEQTGASHDPIVWVEAEGANVIDADGNRYVDLTSGFGVAFVGHRHPEVVAAAKHQADRLLHALGDLHPSDVKIELLERLCALAPWPQARAMLSLSGADAVTAALKTAVMATGKTGVVAFEGSYHGLTYGPLAVSGYAERFRQPFQAQLQSDVHFAAWPGRDVSIDVTLQTLPQDWSHIGAVIIEPIQGRAGVRLPPPGFVEALKAACEKNGALLIADEIFTGLGRCGAWWRSVDEGVVPDVICVGKALGGGLPVSACVASEDVMRAWGTPDREAIHTGTFYGDPLGSAAALATIALIEREQLVQRAIERGDAFADALRAEPLRGVLEVRHAGMMLGLQLHSPMQALSVARALLERGYLVLPAGTKADVLQLAPPVMMSDAQRDGFVSSLRDVLEGR
ncbi:MAG: aspartate aminotransferase family protein [Deltaproteobacteria bacterium]|nr:MAG: aspartate aminotransferase family protein [Deltaproteobacteria bacterium]UCF48502.1 MAG: aspartate aminotransferase family protein [Myxococcales bacterium]